MMLKINDKVLIYRGKDAGLIGVVIAKDIREGVEFVTVAKVPSRFNEQFHVRSTDVRMASCLDVGRPAKGEPSHAT